MMSAKYLQYDKNQHLMHFLAIEGLPRPILERILQTAKTFIDEQNHITTKSPLLRGKTIVNLFFEASTRTRSTFELAAKRLSADLLTVNIASSATKKGESLLDTIHNLQAMNADAFVVRHPAAGAPHFIAENLTSPAAVLNAGDGCHEHPTQAMLDMFTIQHYKSGFNHLTVAIVGDILHSRVARSLIHALNTLGSKEVRVIAPKTLLPHDIESLGVKPFHAMSSGLKDVDVIIMLRLQEERMLNGLLPNKKEFFTEFGLTSKRLAQAKPDAIVMHPGPINRGVEIASDVVDSSQAVILQQVNFGIAVRMAIMAMIISGQTAK